MSKLMNTLSMRVALGATLFTLFITAIFVSLISATNEARRVDRDSHSGSVMVSSATAARARVAGAGPRSSPDSIKRAASVAVAAAATADLAKVGPEAGNQIRAAAGAYVRDPKTGQKRLLAALGSAIDQQRTLSINDSDELSDALNRALLLGVLGLIGSVISVIVFGVGMFRSVTRPVRGVVATAQRLGAGELSARVPERGVADMQELAASINSLARSLEQTRRELDAQHKNLEVSRQDADRANQAKSEFLSRMSHELRTPLNAILGFAQLLELDDVTPRQRENITHIVTGGKHLLDLINEVLEISRIEAGSMIPMLEPINGASIVHETLDLVMPLASQRGIELIPKVESGKDLWIAADHQHLKQILLNLIANAVKYNRERGSVTVGTKAVDGQAQIYVTDTGPGIPEEKLSKLFVPFERLGAEGTEVEGTGLGLVLAQRLTEAMYGTITVESTEWVGSTFNVNLPVTNAPSYAAPEPEEKKPESQEHVAPDPNKIWRVLYIEDDSANARLMSRLFQEEPRLELMTTMYGERGIAIARELKPDLILLDIHLPDIDGDQVIQVLGSEWETQTIPVIVVTADATEAQRSKMMGLGAADFLTKPLTLEVLLTSIWGVLKPKTAVRQTGSATPA